MTFLSVSLACSSVEKASLPETVGTLDLVKYQGTWNQLAAIPNDFQSDCLTNTTAEYRMLDSGRVKVVNRCETKKGTIKVIEGRARVNPTYNQYSKLQVTFVKLLGWIWAFGGNYWILEIDKDYTTTVIGEPGFKYGWILSRKKSLEKSEYKRLSSILSEKGYDPCRFIISSTTVQKQQQDLALCNILKGEDSVKILKMEECPESPNCVSTQTKQMKKRMAPVPTNLSPAETIKAIKEVVLEKPNTQLIQESPHSLHFIFTSRVFGFVDDVIFLIDTESNLVHYRSASRIGYSDLGANKRRMARLSQELLKKLDKTGTSL
ncbi:MAG: lipocalin family protein [Bdellovibrionales bacterium]|nr:lipocalin family protein [Bdellovibrionales bacterium]